MNPILDILEYVHLKLFWSAENENFRKTLASFFYL